jgi:hypothetical protein
VTDAEAWQQQAPRPQPHHPDDPPPRVQEHGVDREPHPERVDRPAPFEQQPPTLGELLRATEAAHALATGLGDLDVERSESGTAHRGRP